MALMLGERDIPSVKLVVPRIEAYVEALEEAKVTVKAMRIPWWKRLWRRRLKG